MLTVAEALSAILNEVRRPAPVMRPLDESLGLVLAEDVISDVDSPPFDKALMDGYAVRAEDVATGRAMLRVIEEVTAGHIPRHALGAGEATRIMTGAPLPPGADAVVPVEETEAIDEEHEAGTEARNLGRVRIDAQPVPRGSHVLPRGAATRQGDRVLPAGRMLRPQEIGALAESGRATVQVYRRPRVGILATGDELVPAAAQPGPGQIRNSNEPMLAAQIRQAGGEPVLLGIARDERQQLRQRIEQGLTCDLLLLSGGVSAGKLDLVPSELAAAGVRQVFHQIRMKPGKPLWFGVFERPPAGGTVEKQSCYVFGLPGNPVSSMVCCELFARAALRRLLGIEPAAAVPLQARLTEAHSMRGNRPTYHPALLEWLPTGPTVHAVDWIGSSDLRATVDANAMVYFPPGERTFAAGEIVDVYPW
jgi:molybdopterin molybdotransferase